MGNELLRISPPDTLPPSMMRRELSYRKGFGIEVTLTWLALDNILELHYVDETANEAWVSVVPNNRGNDAFAHPNAYRPTEV